MISEHADQIINDINRVRKKEKNIDFLLQKYYRKEEKDFIQKYAETEIAYLSKKLGWDAYWISIVALTIGLVGLGAALFPDLFKPYSILYYIIITLFEIALFIYIVGNLLINWNMFKEFSSGKDVFKKIIIEIQAVNIQNNVQMKPYVIPKLDSIISNTNEINSKMDALEKNVSIKIENDFTIDEKGEIATGTNKDYTKAILELYKLIITALAGIIFIIYWGLKAYPNVVVSPIDKYIIIFMVLIIILSLIAYMKTAKDLKV
jgi:hypothetical protein